MNSKTKILISSKYLKTHFKRYLFLLAAIVFSFTIITVMNSVFEGMYRNVYNSAKNHYGGELIVLGFDKESGNMGIIRDEKKIIEAAENTGYKYNRIIKRTSFFADGMLYFAGNSSRQKNVTGVDFENEKKYFESLDLIDGNIGELDNTNSIIISDIVAEKLKVKTGDDIVLKTRTIKGQANTGNFIVKAVFKDRSIFGFYKCFIDIKHLNNLLQLDEKECSTIGFTFDKSKTAEKMSFSLYSELESKGFPLSTVIKDKNDYKYQLEKNWNGTRYFVMTLSLFVSQIDELLTAMRYISYFIYLSVSLIILVSISVTYKIIINERTGEIATMKAIGFKKKDVYQLFLFESIMIFLVSLFTGMFISLILLKLLSIVSFSSIPGFGIFLIKSHLTPVITFKSLTFNIMIMIFITFPSFYKAFKSGAETDLAKALSENK